MRTPCRVLDGVFMKPLRCKGLLPFTQPAQGIHPALGMAMRGQALFGGPGRDLRA